MTVESKSGRTPSVLIRGDYYDSAYGPTILLVMMSSAACKWLQRLFRDLAELGVPRIFTAEPEIHLENIGEIKMVRRSSGPLVSIRREPGRSNDSEQSFEWSATDDGWLHLRDLVQALCEHGAGHQYLTDHEDDAALVELSLGEQSVLDTVRSAQDDKS
jgi:hypothetical protein